jgi:hypothetical protein
MSLLIQRPRQLRNDIDVFLELVIDELVEMFEKGVQDVWDEYKKEHVTIKAVLIATITDLLGRGSFFGDKTKGYTGCVACLDDTDVVNLPNNSKMVYMGHRRFLPKDHPYRKNRKDFNGTIDKCLAPRYQDGPVILCELNKLEVVLGKGENAVAEPDGSVWKKKNQFSRNSLTGHF